MAAYRASWASTRLVVVPYLVRAACQCLALHNLLHCHTAPPRPLLCLLHPPDRPHGVRSGLVPRVAQGRPGQARVCRLEAADGRDAHQTAGGAQRVRLHWLDRRRHLARNHVGQDDAPLQVQSECDFARQRDRHDSERPRPERAAAPRLSRHGRRSAAIRGQAANRVSGHWIYRQQEGRLAGARAFPQNFRGVFW